ncbi:cytochrome P450 [Nonomuraea sp. NPDC049419]|uniref:cytochrome P450 n=1 Tax=Nonomuraea sp. NPDC049419 TaxID=3155772 RepID=UPI003436D8EC
MRIGELAALLGVSTRTVRYYHHQGVLPEASRRANGYSSAWYAARATDPEVAARGQDFYRRPDELAEAKPDDSRSSPVKGAHMTTTTPTLPFDRPDPMEPPPAYARLRARTPVARVLTPAGQPAWLVTSYDAVTAVLSDRGFGLAPPGTDFPGNDTLFQDGEAHARLRRLVSKTFSPRSLAALRGRIEQLTAGYVSAVAGGGPPADLVAELATPLSITVISELLGVRIDERERFRDLADAASAADFVFGAEEDMAAAAQAWDALGGYAAGLVAAKRKEPGDDLLSGLIAVRDTDDGRLSDTELVAMTTTIVSSGYLSARNAISVGTIRLLTEGRLATLATAGSDQANATVAEVLRMQAGLTGEPFPRYAQHDLELAGVPISAGDLVLVRLEAANRDPRRFPEPDRFLPGRKSSPPLVFGHGLHYCLGAPLARLEVGTTLSALARQLPDLQLQDPVHHIEWTRNAVDIGPVALRVTW